MSYSPGFAEQVLDLMSGAGKVSSKKMFGELGIYHGAMLFAMVADDVLYFKAKDTLASELKALGQMPFIYHGRSGKEVSMAYWTAPVACLDDADEMIVWCRMAVASLNAAPKKLPAKAAKRKAK
jgi:DNA transformation protein and related proteins